VMWVCLVGFGREGIFLWVLCEILGDEIICCGATSMWWACVGDFGGSMDVFGFDGCGDSTVSDDVEEGAISRLTLEFMASTSSRISRIIEPKLSSKRSSLWSKLEDGGEAIIGSYTKLLRT
jgi:hypothetical protein